MKKYRKLSFTLIICLLFAGFAGHGFIKQAGYRMESDAEYARQEAGESADNADLSSESGDTSGSDFEVHILDVGQGLSVLIKADGYYMLYDGGGSDYSSYVVAYLREEGIDTLTYLVASHYDADHISGLVGVLNTVIVETALTPDYTTDSNIYRSFRKMLESSSASEVHPAAGDTFMLGSAEIQILNPTSYTYEDENDNSIVMRIVYGNFSCLLTGDAGEEAEADMLVSGYTLDADLYIVGHHGSAWSSTDDFVDAVSPVYAVISAGEGNSYGHPAKRTLSALKEAGAVLYRTDVQGEIVCYTDGTDCWFNVDSSNNWLSGEELSTAETDGTDTAQTGTSGEESSTEQQYVLNTHTMKFHYPDCPSVSQMSEANKEIVTANRETLIQDGYSPCGNCCP